MRDFSVGCRGLVKRVSAVVAAIAVFGLLSCDDNSVASKPSQPKDYPIYFWNHAGPGPFYEYHPSTRTLDSTELNYDLFRWLGVSADGRTFFFSHDDRVSVVDGDSLSLITELPYAGIGPVVASPDGQVLALIGSDFWLLDAHDYTVLYEDTAELRGGSFLHGSRLFVGEGDRHIHIVNVKDSTVAVREVGQSEPFSWDMAITPDGRKLIQYLRRGFRVFDLWGDSTLFEEWFYPGEGFLAMTPNGRYAFYSNPSTPFGAIGVRSFKVFDIRANRILMEVETDSFVAAQGYPPGFGFGVGRMVVTPDGRWLYAHDFWPGTQFLLFDIKTMRLVDFHHFGDNYWFMNPAVQSGY